MSRRKHVMLNMLQQEVEAPIEGQHIVRAAGSRGSNIMEVEFPDGRRTLCLIPARFHKKLWIKTGTYLMIEDSTDEETEQRVTGHIVNVLYGEHVKQLKKMEGVWPAAFNDAEQPVAAPEEEGSSSRRSGREAAADVGAALQGLSISGEGGAAPAQEGAAGLSANGVAQQAAERGEQSREESSSESDDDLPPLTRIQNRRVVEYDVSESDSD